MTRNGLRRLVAICAVLFLVTFPVQKPLGQELTGCTLYNNKLPGTPKAGNTGLAIDYALLDDGAELSRLFAVQPAIFYMEETDEPNACAVWLIYPTLLAEEGREKSCCPDGTVLIGLDLIQSEWRSTGGSGLSIPAILAHEYAHIAQFKYNSPLKGKWVELHADYLAGWYTGHRCRFRACNPFQAMKNFYYKGDYAFNDSSHGTPVERERAFRAGFELNTIYSVASGMAAYRAGMNYVKACGAPMR
jgi:hypothetical protein